MKKLLFAVILLVTILPFTNSCSKTDDPASSNASIVGQWQVSKIFYEYYEGTRLVKDHNEFYNAENGWVWEFRSDKNFTEIRTQNGMAIKTSTGTYVKTSTMIIFTYVTGNSGIMTLNIESMKGNNIIAFEETPETADTYRVVTHYYLEKIG